MTKKTSGDTIETRAVDRKSSAAHFFRHFGYFRSTPTPVATRSTRSTVYLVLCRPFFGLMAWGPFNQYVPHTHTHTQTHSQ